MAPTDRPHPEPAPNPPPRPAEVRRRLLAWYDRHRRRLPWRAQPGRRPDPYRVWLSEIMLQQTTVATVTAYYDAFVARWPDVTALAAAGLDDVLHAWQGLGYYARARNLHKCARVVAETLGGRFPDSERELRELPGIGAYTAAAVAAIAFGEKATPVDGNIERVTARLFAVADPLPAGRKRIEALAASLTAPRRPGDFAQAMMDLGATVCTPADPNCGACPLKSPCLAVNAGEPARYPVKPPKKTKPRRHGVVFWAVRADGGVMLEKRPAEGLLGGMMAFPTTDWRAAPWGGAEAAERAPVAGPWRRLDGVVKHTFTHFHLELRVLTLTVRGAVNGKGGGGAVWCRPEKFSDHALPTLMKKVARHAQGAAG